MMPPSAAPSLVGVACAAAIVLGAITLTSATKPAHTLPDPRLTPGAVTGATTAEICAPGYARAHRVWPWPEGKRETLRRYGLPWALARDYEDDDLVPVCLGGDNADVRNHWPQPWPEARAKDRVEAEMCRAVCAGEIGLKAAQERFLRGQW